MTELARAAEIAEAMRRALEREVLRARDQRVLIRKMNGEALLASARQRDAFNVQIASWEGALASLFATIKTDLSLSELTLESLALHAPVASAPLRERLGEVRALASALRELDQLNVQLAERGLTYVRSYNKAVLPRPSAYDRHGAPTAGPRLSTSSKTV